MENDFDWQVLRDAHSVSHPLLDLNQTIQEHKPFIQSFFVAPSDKAHSALQVSQLCSLTVTSVDASSASMSILSTRPALTIEPCEF